MPLLKSQCIVTKGFPLLEVIKEEHEEMLQQDFRQETVQTGIYADPAEIAGVTVKTENLEDNEGSSDSESLNDDGPVGAVSGQRRFPSPLPPENVFSDVQIDLQLLHVGVDKRPPALHVVLDDQHNLEEPLDRAVHADLGTNAEEHPNQESRRSRFDASAFLHVNLEIPEEDPLAQADLGVAGGSEERVSKKGNVRGIFRVLD